VYSVYITVTQAHVLVVLLLLLLLLLLLPLHLLLRQSRTVFYRNIIIIGRHEDHPCLPLSAPVRSRLKRVLVALVPLHILTRNALKACPA